MELIEFIKVYTMDSDVCDEILKGKTSDESWRQHTWYNYGNGENYSHDDKELEIMYLKQGETAEKTTSEIIRTMISKYSEEFPDVSITHFTNARLNRYKPGMLMRRHVDHIHQLFDGTIKGIPILTILMNLNDGYEGGQLVLCGKEYHLKKGEVILFPSCFLYPHEIREVTKGVRFSAVVWAW